MAPSQFSPEWKQFVDDSTGAKVLQWTASASMNHHFYFTNPTVSPDGKTGYFVSYRTGHPNVFSIDLSSGVLMPLSNRVDINPFSPAPSPKAPWIYVTARNAIRAFWTRPFEDRVVCEFKCPRLGNCSLNADGSLIAVSLRYDDYCELAIVEAATGHFEIVTRVKEIGHIQFCPSNSNLLMFSGTVTQRIWLHDRKTGKNAWVYPQKEGEWIVHESWLGAGREIIFPHWPYALRSIHPDGTGLRTIAEVNAWHACSNRQGTQIVCDTNHPDRGLLLINPKTGAYKPLCFPRATLRGTHWMFNSPAIGARIDTSILRSAAAENDKPPHPDDPATTYGPQWSHPHPAFTADGLRVIYTSDRFQWSQVYQVEIPRELLSL